MTKDTALARTAAREATDGPNGDGMLDIDIRPVADWAVRPVPFDTVVTILLT
jgi:hypothetical protein